MRTLIFFFCAFLYINCFAQKNKQNAFDVAYGHQFPIGDLEEQFGDNSAICIAFIIEKNNNIFYGIDANYMFSKNVKDTSIFDNISTMYGAIIASDGHYANVNLMQRGFNSHMYLGYAFHFDKQTLSGLYLSLGLGYLQHKIFIDTKNQDIPQLSENYKKGYDRFSNGISSHLSLTYRYYDKSGKFQIYTGINMTVAYTKLQRKYLFSDMKYASNQRSKDQLLGLKMGIIIPIKRKNEEEFHYY